jgi:hypothetical protein
MGSPQAGMGSQPGFSQPGIEMQPGAQMGYMPGWQLPVCMYVCICLHACKVILLELAASSQS